MDIDFVRTFLAVYDTGTFNRAADQLNVTQSTVSTRIMTLEDQIGQPLFARSRGGTEPTAAGRRFHPHAANMVRIWKQAKQELELPEHMDGVLSIGSHYSLWDALLSDWLAWMNTHQPHLAVRAQVAPPEAQTAKLLDGELDIGVMYMPQTRVGLVIEHLFVDKLVLVSTAPDSGGPGDTGYVHVDWGPEFQAEHAIAFSGEPFARRAVSHGTLGLGYILAHGGSAYLPERQVRQHLKDGDLHRVKRTPWFSRPAYVVYAAGRDEAPVFQSALDGLLAVAPRIRNRQRATHEKRERP